VSEYSFGRERTDDKIAFDLTTDFWGLLRVWPI
jgi:hypothetical protein